MINLQSEAGKNIAVFLGGLVFAVGAIIAIACYVDDRQLNHKRNQEIFSRAHTNKIAHISGPRTPKEGVISYPEGTQFIVTLHADGKTTVMVGPDWGPMVFAGGRIRLISGTNSIVIEKP